MDIKQFESELKEALLKLDYVESLTFYKVNEVSIKGRIYLKKSYILEVRSTEIEKKYNFTLSFTLLYLDDRIWGLDKDNRVGWHIHPLENTKLHEPIEPKSVKEIVATFDLVCGKFFQ
jgi:hypothetical protein